MQEIYYCGDSRATAAMIRKALPDIFCADTLALAKNAIHKLESMGGMEFAAQFEGESCNA